MTKRVDQRSKDENLRGRKLRMAVLLAEMREAQEVANIIAEEFNVKMMRQEVYAFERTAKGRKLIAFLRSRFLANFAKIPIANKSVQLSRLEKIYHESMTESLKSTNQWGEIYEVKLGAAIEAIKTAWEIVNGKKSGKQEDDSQIETILVELLKKRVERLGDGEKIKITRCEHRALDRFVQKPS